MDCQGEWFCLQQDSFLLADESLKRRSNNDTPPVFVSLGIRMVNLLPT